MRSSIKMVFLFFLILTFSILLSHYLFAKSWFRSGTDGIFAACIGGAIMVGLTKKAFNKN